MNISEFIYSFTCWRANWNVSSLKFIQIKLLWKLFIYEYTLALLLGKYLVMKWLAHMVDFCLTLPNFFPKRLSLFPFPPAVHESPSFSIALATCGRVTLFHFSHSYMEVESHCGFNLYSPCHPCPLLMKYLLNISPISLIGLFLFHCTLRVLYIFWI